MNIRNIWRFYVEIQQQASDKAQKMSGSGEGGQSTSSTELLKNDGVPPKKTDLPEIQREK